MKKIYLSFLSLAMVVGANAQQTNKALLTKHHTGPATVSTPNKPTVSNQEKAVVWSDDFSNASTWTMTNTSAPISWDWVITTNQGDIPNAAPSLQPFASTTAANGFALIDSDGQPGNVDGDGAIVANMRNATPINLSAYPNVILQFQHSYRWWQDTRGVRVSGDGGTTWTSFDITDANGYPNLQNSENPVTEVINISAIAGGSSNVLIEFYYNDNDFWGWYWVVDDVEILEQPADDIQNLSAWFVGATNEGVEYGRTPSDQLDASYDVGAQVYNFGYNDQTNIALTADFVSFSATSGQALLQSDSTAFIESNENPNLSVGVYNGTYTVVSALETSSSPDFGNNVYLRNFEVTNDLYSMDGIGIHPPSMQGLTNLGTGSFNGAEDGLVAASMYYIKNTEQVGALQVMLDPASVAGGELYGSIKDTGLFIAGDMTTSTLYSTSGVTLTAGDISNGYVILPFNGGATLNPGAYYAAVEMYSNGNSADVFIVDDYTVVQPFWASAIYIPGDQSYTNGEALGIRLMVNNVGVEENTMDGVTVYPNPSEGVINVSNDNHLENTIRVHDLAGREVMTLNSAEATTLDLSTNGSGVYTVTVSNANGYIVERVVIK